MVAFMCNFYSLGYRDVMDLPVRAFFALYKEGTKMEARQYRELLRIQAVSIMNLKYYEFMKDHYDAIIDPESIRIPEAPGGPFIALDSEEGRDLLRGVFGKMKRGLGYGR